MCPRHINALGKPSYTYLYITEVDHTAHDYGPKSPKVQACLTAVDKALSQLKESIARPVRFIVTADHGQTHVPEDKKIGLRVDDELLDSLSAPPSGEARMPLFHVKAGREGTFLERFHALAGHLFAAVPVSASEQWHLFGPNRLSPRMLSRLGNYIGISAEPAALIYLPSDARVLKHRGFHGGLKPEETKIPLFLA